MTCTNNTNTNIDYKFNTTKQQYQNNKMIAIKLKVKMWGPQLVPLLNNQLAPKTLAHPYFSSLGPSSLAPLTPFSLAFDTLAHSSS